MDALRTLAFGLVFYGLSVPMVLGTPIAAALGPAFMRRYVKRWLALQRWSARSFLGISTQIVGTIPDTPVLFAAKHESLFEALELTRLLGAPATVMKRELTRIPLWGWAAKRYGVIVVERSANARALRAMMREAKAALAEGRSVLIFPEGTRVQPGEAPALRSGMAGLYRMLDLPVVPIAVASGHVWPKRGPKHPGTVTFHFGEPIPPGLPRAEVEARVHAGINALNRTLPRRG
jgi:1-acyl-sn-glycerol-3-phosphate acyltransferase